jgi:serine/threonine-protein kinase
MNQCNVPPGTAVTGKWHGNRYLILKRLGSGANGTVYLIKGNGGYAALKMSQDSMSVISEANVLKSFSQVQGTVLGPSLLDVDDWERGNGQTVPFYVMEYIHGPNMLDFVREKGFSWAGIMMVQLLGNLEALHRHGWIFGDLKPENLIVSAQPARIRCIDVGGITKQGRAVKEFTEFFDRGYWGLGSRKAEPSYDLFSAAMVMLNVFYPNRFQNNGSGLSGLKEKIRSIPDLARYEPILEKALTGQYRTANEMKKEILSKITRTEMKRGDKRRRQKKKKGSAKETAAVIFVTAFLYGLYIYLYL